MKTAVYEFDKVNFGKSRNYIFQYVQQRKLSLVAHAHDFYEMIYVLRGVCTQGVDGVRYEMKHGATALLRPGEAHVFFDQTDDLELIGLSVRKEEFERVCGVLGERVLDDLKTSSAPPVVAACEPMLHMERVVRFPFAAHGDEEYVLLLLSMIKALLDRRRQAQAVPPALERLLEEMRERDRLRGGLAAMVALSGYSQSHLFRLIRQYIGVNPNEYIKNLRLEVAYHDLVSTDLRPEDIAADVGYESFSHFNKIFKQKYGITPGALRKLSGAWAT